MDPQSKAREFVAAAIEEALASCVDARKLLRPAGLDDPRIPQGLARAARELRLVARLVPSDSDETERQ